MYARTHTEHMSKWMPTVTMETHHKTRERERQREGEGGGEVEEGCRGRQ